MAGLRKFFAVVPVLILSVFVLSVAAQAFSETRRFSDVVALARIADDKSGWRTIFWRRRSMGCTPSLRRKSAVRISSRPGYGSFSQISMQMAKMRRRRPVRRVSALPKAIFVTRSPVCLQMAMCGCVLPWFVRCVTPRQWKSPF